VLPPTVPLPAEAHAGRAGSRTPPLDKLSIGFTYKAVEGTQGAIVRVDKPLSETPFVIVNMIQVVLYYTDVPVSVSLDLETLRRVGTALADPTRRRVLVQLIDGPGYPADMAEDFGATRANLSNHLTCLRECGLVTAFAEGRRVRYELADRRLAEGLRILASLDLPGSCG
jgi:DNA-binding transcriptional ArsR family regulator